MENNMKNSVNIEKKNLVVEEGKFNHKINKINKQRKIFNYKRIRKVNRNGLIDGYRKKERERGSESKIH